MNEVKFYLVFATLQIIANVSAAEKYSFLVVGDPQYLAEKSHSPKRLDPYSETANSRAIALLKSFSGRSIPEDHGGGKVSGKIRKPRIFSYRFRPTGLQTLAFCTFLLQIVCPHLQKMKFCLLE